MAMMVVLSGCVQTPEPQVRVDPVVTSQVLASAAAQVRRCYRSPKISSAGRRIVTRLEVRLNADGTLASLPVTLSQTGVPPATQAEASQMAEAASLAVIHCAPLKLPAEHYILIWERFELTFSPAFRV
jgi:hypothetical protein